MMTGEFRPLLNAPLSIVSSEVRVEAFLFFFFKFFLACKYGRLVDLDLATIAGNSAKNAVLFRQFGLVKHGLRIFL